MSENKTWSGYASYEIADDGKIVWTGYYIHTVWFGDEICLWFDESTNVIRGKCGVFVEIPEGELPAVCTQLKIANYYFDILKIESIKEIVKKNNETIERLRENNCKYLDEAIKIQECR